jgi:hypothetical protein
LLRKISPQQRELLETATSRYEASRNGEVLDYLTTTRGAKVAEAAAYYRLGYVEDPVDGHEKFVGRMAIPYVTPAGVVDLRFRCISDHDCKTEQCPKYLGMPEARPTLFNTRSFKIETDGICLTEGEMDSLAVEQECHVPAVGYPGVSTWKKNQYWRRCFPGYQVVYVLADGDQPGMDAAHEILRDLPNGRLVQMPHGHDATSFLQEQGPQALLRKMGLEK